MSETMLGTVPLLGIIIIAIGCWLYMLGGRGGKWKRRVIGSAVCATAVWVMALILGVFKLGMLGLYPLLAIAFSLGYGSEIDIVKVVKRTIVVLATLVSGILMAYLLQGKAWLILPVQFLVGAVSIWLGVKNPTPAAPEEFFVCLFLTECLIIYPFTVK